MKGIPTARALWLQPFLIAVTSYGQPSGSYGSGIVYQEKKIIKSNILKLLFNIIIKWNSFNFKTGIN